MKGASQLDNLSLGSASKIGDKMYINKFIMDGVELWLRDEEADHDGGSGDGLTLQQIVDAIYPVGAVLFRNDDSDPNVFIGVGTWTSAPVGDFIKTVSLAGSRGGTTQVQLDETNLPKHTHEMSTAGDHTHGVSMQEAGSHTHDVAVTSNGVHNHDATVSQGGVHSHSAEAESAGAHTHPATIKYSFNQLQANTNNGVTRTWDNGDQTSANMVSVDEAGEHTHTVTVDESGSHNHNATIESAGSHTHGASAQSAGSHQHVTNLSETGAHVHTLAATGGGEPITINPPYHGVVMWIRTA